MVAGISRSGRAEIAALTGRGRRLVTTADASAELGLDRWSTSKRLARWTEQGWLRRVRRDLYIPVPLDAPDPSSWSEDVLVVADAVWSPCYFTGWTAANHWGLTEQVFRTTLLKTARRVRAAHHRLLDHDYRLAHVSEADLGWGMAVVWRDECRLAMADPARTVVDILDDPELAGGMRLAAEIVDAFLQGNDPELLIAYGERLGNQAVFKRLGYTIEALGMDQPELVLACRARISRGVSLLDPTAPGSGPRVAEWGLRANVRLDEVSAS